MDDLAYLHPYFPKPYLIGASDLLLQLLPFISGADPESARSRPSWSVDALFADDGAKFSARCNVDHDRAMPDSSCDVLFGESQNSGTVDLAAESREEGASLQLAPTLRPA